MKVANKEIYNCKTALEELVKVKLPVKTSLQAAKFANKVSEKLKAIDEVRLGLIKTYGEKNDKGQISVSPESPKWEQFAKEFNELMEIEEEFVFEKIKIPEKVTGTCDACKHNMDVTLQIEPSVLMALERFIEIG